MAQVFLRMVDRSHGHSVMERGIVVRRRFLQLPVVLVLCLASIPSVNAGAAGPQPRSGKPPTVVLAVTAPSSTSAGTPFSFAVTALALDNSVESGFGGVVAFKSSDPHAALPAPYTFTASNRGSHRFVATLKTAALQTVQAYVKVNQNTPTPQVPGSGYSAVILVHPGPAAVASLIAPGATITGRSIPLAATLRDAFGNVDTEYTGTVRFASNDTGAKLPAGYTFLPTDNGTHYFTASFSLAGTQHINMVETALHRIVASVTIAVGAAGPVGTYTVTSTEDSASCPNGSSGPGYTLRCAITDVNAAPANIQKQIVFAISASGVAQEPHCKAGVCTISPHSALPAVAASYVTLDGYLQAGAHPNTAATGSNAAIAIRLDGASAGSADGLRLTGTGDVIRGLAITGFSGAGINIDTTAAAHRDASAPTKPAVADATTVTGVFAGIAPDGVTPAPNANGIRIARPAGLAAIGGSDPGSRNVLSGNSQNGLVEDACPFCAARGYNRIQGNLLGTNAAGTKAVPNGNAGFSGVAPFDLVGGVAAGAGNLLSGNGAVGARVGTLNTVQGNRIGTSAAGTANVPNGGTAVGVYSGLELLGSDFVGSATPGTGNVISGNNGNGISIEGPENVIQGNLIGTATDGATPLPNGATGIAPAGILSNSGFNRIGGAAGGTGNVISATIGSQHGNSGAGIVSRGADLIQGNIVGMDRSGARALPNAGFGIHDLNGYDVIGGAIPGAGNLISGNGDTALRIDGGYAQIQANRIGTNAAGTARIASSGSGILLAGPQNLVGGPGAIAPNVLGSLAGDGVTVLSPRNTIWGNSIGVSGALSLPNGGAGVSFSNAGPENAVAGNSIGNNTSGGIVVVHTAGAVGITGNTVATNGADGILISAGGPAYVANNVVTHNKGNGLYFAEAGPGNTVASNTITGNGGSGVLVGAASSDTKTRVLISANSLWANAALGIDLAPAGSVNCALPAPGPNGYQNCPVISGATKSVVRGTACGGCTVEVYLAAADAGDKGYGEGKTLLGSTRADSNGNWRIDAPFATPAQPGGLVTATAIDARFTETSEFAANVQITSS